MIGRAKQQELFHAINEKVMDLRIQIQTGEVTMENIDRRLFNLVNDVWQQQCKVLGLKG
jgi:hypothetical protein